MTESQPKPQLQPPALRSSISVVVPVFNSEGTLDELVSRLKTVLSQFADEWEIILVNDGSQDESWRLVCKVARQYSWIRGIDLMRNYGQHNALHPPEEIPLLLAKLHEGYDVVYGTPAREQHGLWRDLASRVTKLVLQSAMGAEMARKVSAFRVFRTQVREAFANYQVHSSL